MWKQGMTVVVLCSGLLGAGAVTAETGALATAPVRVAGEQATNSFDVWRAAQGNDMEFAAARAARHAGETRREQGASFWRPSLQFSGTVGVANADSSINGARFSAPGFGTVDGANFDTSINGGTATRWAPQARQPLFNRERDAGKRQVELSADVAELEWQSAQQALMLRTAERYFDAALATESLRVLRRQQDAVERSLLEASDRFKLGDAPVTDTQEAAARAQAIRAEVLAAETNLTLKQAALADVTGWSGSEVQSLALAQGGVPQDLPALAAWLVDAKAGNLQLRMQSASVEVVRHGRRPPSTARRQDRRSTWWRSWRGTGSAAAAISARPAILRTSMALRARNWTRCWPWPPTWAAGRR